MLLSSIYCRLLIVDDFLRAKRYLFDFDLLLLGVAFVGEFSSTIMSGHIYASSYLDTAITDS